MKVNRDYFLELSKNVFESLENSEALSLELIGENSDYIRFNHSRVRQTGSVDDFELGGRYLKKMNGQIHSSNFALRLNGEIATDKNKLQTKLDEAKQDCQDLPIDPFVQWPQGDFKSETIQLGQLTSATEMFEPLFQTPKNMNIVGIFSTGRMLRASAHSEGAFHWFEKERYDLDFSVFTPSNRSIKYTRSGRQWDQAHYVEEVEKLYEQQKLLEKPAQTIPRGQYRVYLAPAAVSEILTLLSHGVFSEAAIRQKQSPFFERSKKLSAKVNFYEDFRYQDVPRFNEYGSLAPEVIPIIQEGELRESLIGQRTAGEYQLSSNAASDNECMKSPLLDSGALDEDLIETELGNGLWISNLHYLNWSDLIGGRITGMTRYACFVIEGGEKQAPFENMRFDASIFDILGPQLIELSNHCHEIPNTSTYFHRSPGAIRTPGLIIENFPLTL